MKKINGLMILTLLSTVGCSTQTGTSPTELQALSKQCELDIPASQETQEIVWEAVWNRDQSQVIAFKKGERAGERYTLANSVSVEYKEFQVLISDFDRDSLEMISNARQTFRPNTNNGSSTTSNARPYRYFEVLFVENIFPQESVYLIEQHRISNQQDMLNIYKAMKNKETLTQLPESQKEACFNVTAEAFEDIAINVTHEGGSGWQNPQHIQDVFQNRQVYLTTTYGAWRPSEDESKRAETGLHIHMADDSNESRDPVTIAFKQLNREFNRPNAEVRYNITGLQIPRQLPVIGAVPDDLPNFISKNDLSDDVFNLLVQRKVLNPFEVIFDLSGGTGQEQMDFTVEITTNPRKIRQANVL